MTPALQRFDVSKFQPWVSIFESEVSVVKQVFLDKEMNSSFTSPAVLTIAGTDPSGGAGIQVGNLQDIDMVLPIFSRNWY